MATKPADFDIREARCRELGLHVKFDAQLQDLLPMYAEQLQQIRAELLDSRDAFREASEVRTLLETFVPAAKLDAAIAAVRKELIPERLQRLVVKRQRIIVKRAAVQDEIWFRQEGWVERTPRGTTYYIDLNNGSDSADGLTTGTAWRTIQKYTSVTVRSAGDIAKVRANTTQVLAAVVDFDETGTSENPITIKGCSIADDPWGDASDVQPTFDYNFTTTAAIKFNMDCTEWKLERLRFFQGNTSNWTVFITNTSTYVYVKDCQWSQCRYGPSVSIHAVAVFDGCTFTGYSTNGVLLNANYGTAYCYNCIFDGSGSTGDVGILGERNAEIFLSDCQFAQTTEFNSYDIDAKWSTRVLGRNIKFGASPDLRQFDQANYGPGYIAIEDYNGTLHDNRTWFFGGTIARSTSIVRAGGAGTSVLFGVNAYLSLDAPLRMCYDCWQDGALRVWCPAKAQTITVWIYGDGWGTNFPTAVQLWLEARYLSAASGATRTVVKSTQVLVANQTWTAFTVSFTPQQEGWVFLSVILGKYVSGATLNVDPRPVMA